MQMTGVRTKVTVNQLALFFNMASATNSYYKDHRGEGQLKSKTGVGDRNKCTFSCCLNVSRDGEGVMSEDKLFLMHAPDIRKVKRPV